MQVGRATLSVILAASLAACGGGGGGGGGAPPIAGTPTPTPTPTTSTCSLSDRQDWVLGQLQEFYLFPDLLDTTVNKANFVDVQSYIDAVVAPARAESKDRFFTFITSIQEENDFINNASTAGFGIRLGYDTPNGRVFVIEAFENAPAFPQGFDRGVEILAVGTNANNLQTTASLLANGGPSNFSAALGPSDPGLSRTFRIRQTDGSESTVTVSKAEFSLDPVSDRYGAQIINDNGKQVGYINLRTFGVDAAETELLNAFADFRAQGVTEFIVDYRYNGGGLVRVAELMGDLLGQQFVGQTFSNTVFRQSLSNNNDTEPFQTAAQGVQPTKIAFIGFGGTASASELVINSFIPYLGNDMALVGGNTFGKPVGQIARDRQACDDRLRVVAFQTTNADNQGEYFTGLGDVVPVTCRATDDIFSQLGDPNEASVAEALDFLRTGASACTAISGVQRPQEQRTFTGVEIQEPVMPKHPSSVQRDVPGLH